MKALLTSSFRYIGNFFLPSLDFNRKDLTCLFVRYALQDEGHINMCKQVLKNCLPIKKMIDFAAQAEGGRGEILQISGGEPTLHKNIIEIIEYARKNFQYVMLNTNGIKIAEDEEFVKELSKFK